MTTQRRDDSAVEENEGERRKQIQLEQTYDRVCIVHVFAELSANEVFLDARVVFEANLCVGRKLEDDAADVDAGENNTNWCLLKVFVLERVADGDVSLNGYRD